MKSEMVVVESLKISNLYIKNKEIMTGFICTDSAKIQIANFSNSR